MTCDGNLRGQEASLESSKGSYNGNKSNLTILSTHAPKSIKIAINSQKPKKSRLIIGALRVGEVGGRGGSL